MKFFVAAATLVSLVPSILGLTVNTPTNVVQCQPLLLTWADGTPPYFLSAIPGGQPSAAALKTFPTQNGTTLTWKVDLQAGTSISLSLKDNTGLQAFSDAVTVLSSSDSSCVTGDVAATGSAAGGAAPTGGNTGATSLSAASSAGPSPSSATKTAKTGAASGTQSSSPSATNAGSRSAVGTYSLAGVMGLLGIALF